MDGTVRQISRPGDYQRVVYNGHKPVHAIKFQAVVIPSGLVANLYGPVEGWCCDAAQHLTNKGSNTYWRYSLHLWRSCLSSPTTFDVSLP